MRLNRSRVIMAYLSIRSRATFRKYRRLGMPVHEAPTGWLFALTEELDKWERPTRFGQGTNGGRLRAQTGGVQTGNSLKDFKRLMRMLAARPKGRGERA
jgi:hypothetical protein